MPDPLVSVIIITYNHEKYIRDALESCLEQKTDFPFEIIIHDDASTDNTAEIVKEYSKKFPDKIVPIIQKENQHSKGIKITSLVIPYTKGKYIALCEGDDYWTDSKKLQKQVDFLEINKEYSGSAHQSIIISKNHQKIFKKNVNEVLSFHDLLGDRVFHTASFVFRKSLIDIYPKVPVNIHSGDRLLFLLISANGPIRYFDETMCIYRKHEGGISARGTYDLIKKDFNVIPYLEENISSFPKYRYISFLHRICIQYPIEKIPFPKLLKHYLFFIIFSFSEFPKNIRKIVSTTIFILKRYLLYNQNEDK